MSCNQTGITDAALPEVLSTNPASGAENVALDVMITATFSEEMDSASFNTSSFSLRRNDTLVPGIVSVTPTTATFVPLNNLLAGRTYTATITTEVTDAMGYTMDESYEWTFSTISDDEAVEPNIEITSTTPADQSTEIDVTAIITANFSEPMDPATVNIETFSLRQGTSPVPGSVIADDTTATFTPSEDLEPGSTYTATVTTGAESVDGYNLAEDYSWSFTTAGNSNDNPPDDEPTDEPTDNTPPEVTSVDPPNNADDTGINVTIDATFSEEMNPESINTSTFTLRQGDDFVEGTVEYSGTTATFVPNEDLAYDQTYTATITNGVEDTTGNNLSSNVEWNFTTEESPDILPPEITDVNPVNGDSDVNVNTNISVTFSEEMNPENINTSTFNLFEDGPGNSTRDVSGSVEYSGLTATFTPSENLKRDETYTAIITSEVTDIAGNRLEESFRWEFRTGDDEDDDDEDDD